MDRIPSSATVQVSADSRYRLYVNGTSVAFGPVRSYQHRQCVDVHDVTDLLQVGDNVIGVLVYQPGYSHYSYVHREKSGLWLMLEVDQQPLLCSDSAWTASRDPSYSSNGKRISIYGAGQEICDLRLREAWLESEFDDQAWEAASVSARQGEGPWLALQTAPLKNLVETVEHSQRVAVRLAPYVAHADPHEEIRSAFLSKMALDAPAVELSSAVLPAVAQDRVLLICYALTHSQAGSARLVFRGARGGEKGLVSYLEKACDGRLILSDPSTYCQMRMTDRFELAPGLNTVEPFTPRGGRFVLLGIVGPTSSDLSLQFEFVNRRYPLVLQNEAMPTDAALQPIAQMCWRTLQSCALDGMVDCPWREQAVWVGDSVITAAIIAELCGEPRLLKHMLRLAADGATPDGLMPGVVVHQSESNVVLAYSFAWVEGLANYLKLTGDTDFVLENWDVLVTMLDRFQDDLTTDGLLRAQPARRQFLDWAELPGTEPSCLYNLRYLYALQIASALAGQFDRADDAQRWHGWAHSLKASIRKMFFRQGIWYDDPCGASRSQHIGAFLTLTGVVSKAEAGRLLREAVARSLEDRDNALVLMSPYMHYYLFLALEQLGRSGDILRVVTYRWTRWLEQGARTTWENWEVDFPDGSQCHGWSAHPLLFMARHAKCERLMEQVPIGTNPYLDIGELEL
ncbi:MAG: alpha-L-rhamnosidase N-terminal domain-containing protein [Pirellulales bacterium]|nr:alpha-L-rhamnosidase N-terminal domain-containing protein [Pirellulales bacterium]